MRMILFTELIYIIRKSTENLTTEIIIRILIIIIMIVIIIIIIRV